MYVYNKEKLVFDYMNALKGQYSNYPNSQCDVGENIFNPELCPASNKYRDYVNKFADSTIQESIKSTEKV